MAIEHSFHLLFESFGRLPVAHAEAVNREAHDSLAETLDVPVEGSGRCILLRAPRAGHGKSHLLSRIQHEFGGTHEFVPIHALGSRIDAMSVTEDVLKRLVRSLPAAGGLTVLDLVVRRLFSFALQPLVLSGEVPCQDRDGAVAALKSRPVETFDFHHPNAVTAHWAKDNFEILGPRLSLELAQRTGSPIREVGFWVNALFRFASTPLENPARSGVLGLEVSSEVLSGTLAMERLVTLLSMLSLLSRVVLVADDLEGFSADETAALKLAAFVGTIRQAADRVDVILSLNQDVWENAFLPRLSGGLADRLSEVVIELKSLTEDEVVALYESRVPGLGLQIASRVKSSETYARGLIRAAGVVWQKEEQELTAKPSLEPAAESEGIFATGFSAEPAFGAEAPVESVQVQESPVVQEAPPVAEVSVPESNFPATGWETPDAPPAPAQAEPVSIWEPVAQWEAVPPQAPVQPEPVTTWEPVAQWEAVPPQAPVQPEPVAKWEPVAQWEAVTPQALVQPEPIATWEPVAQWEAVSPQAPVQSEPVASWEAVPPEPAPAPVVSAPPQFAPQVSTPEGYEPAVLIEPGPQWGRSVFDAVVTDQPPSRPFSDPVFAPQPAAPQPVFEPVFSPPTATSQPEVSPGPEIAESDFIPVTEPEAPAFSSAPESSQPPGWQFQAVTENPAPASDFGSSHFSAPPEVKQPTDEEAQRVDDLLRQFRERYGRGGL